MAESCGKFPHEHSIEGAVKAATGELTKEGGFSQRTRDAQVVDPGLKEVTRTVSEQGPTNPLSRRERRAAATSSRSTLRPREKQVGRIDASAATLGRSDMVVARCWQQWITEGRVYRRGRVRRPRNTNDREDRAIKEWPLRHQQRRASIDSTPLTSFQTSSAIKRNHKETTDRSWFLRSDVR
ncbi:hypothetical protein TNCV_2857541 [Trichonephila clavipes]|nr:hypothetical protein TNCV_2857541 [Trichonephila clavipes]